LAKPFFVGFEEVGKKKTIHQTILFKGKSDITFSVFLKMQENIKIMV
jgi:hypothetical protein